MPIAQEYSDGTKAQLSLTFTIVLAGLGILVSQGISPRDRATLKRRSAGR